MVLHPLLIVSPSCRPCELDAAVVAEFYPWVSVAPTTYITTAQLDATRSVNSANPSFWWSIDQISTLAYLQLPPDPDCKLHVQVLIFPSDCDPTAARFDDRDPRQDLLNGVAQQIRRGGAKLMQKFEGPDAKCARLDMTRQNFLGKGGVAASIESLSTNDENGRSRFNAGRIIEQDPCFRFVDASGNIVDPCPGGVRPQRPAGHFRVHKTVNLHRCLVEGLLHEIGHLHGLGHSGVAVWSPLGRRVAQTPLARHLPNMRYFDISSIISLAMLSSVDGASNRYRGLNAFQLYHLRVPMEPVPNIINNHEVRLYSVSSRRLPFAARVGVKAGQDIRENQVLWLEWRQPLGIDRDLRVSLCRGMPQGPLLDSLLVHRVYNDDEQSLATELVAIVPPGNTLVPLQIGCQRIAFSFQRVDDEGIAQVRYFPPAPGCNEASMSPPQPASQTVLTEVVKDIDSLVKTFRKDKKAKTELLELFFGKQ